MDNPQLSVPPGSFGSALRDAARFWEPRRIAYNLVLVAVTAFWVIKTWPHFNAAINLPDLLRLVVLAGIANAFYCSAYFADAVVQGAVSPGARVRWRWALWIAGMLFAMLITSYWIVDEIYPYVN